MEILVKFVILSIPVLTLRTFKFLPVIRNSLDLDC